MQSGSDGIGGSRRDGEPEERCGDVNPEKFGKPGFRPPHKEEHQGIHPGYEFRREKEFS